MYCGRQCIVLRGDTEGLNTSGNPGNILSLLKLMATRNTVLNEHLKSPAMCSVTCMSPQPQNDLLEVILKHIILHDLVKDAKYFSTHNSKQLALCVRLVEVAT